MSYMSWTVGGTRSTQREPMQAQGEKEPNELVTDFSFLNQGSTCAAAQTTLFYYGTIKLLGSHKKFIRSKQ